MWLQGRTQMIRNAKDYEEAVLRLMNCGFDGVEINAYQSDFSLSPEFYAEGFGTRMRSYLKKLGVRSWTVGAHMDFTKDDDTFEKVLRAIHITEELGSPAMIITGAFRREEEPLEMQWHKQISCMKHLGKEAEDCGIKLAIEYEPGFVIHNSTLLLQALEEAGSPALCVNADLGHFFLEEEDPIGAIELLGERIIHVHAENMKKGVHNHLFPWEGDMDLKAYFKKLREIGFDGPVSLDVYQESYEENAPRAIETLKELLL